MAGTGEEAAQWVIRRDLQTCLAAALVQGAVLSRGLLTPAEQRGVACLMAGTLAAAAAMHLRPARYARAWRTPMVVAIRTALTLIPLAFDTLRAMQPSAVASAAVGAAGGAASTLRAILLLLLPLAWVDGCTVSAVGLPLPPLLHAVLQSLCVALLMRRAPTGALGAAVACVVCGWKCAAG